MYDDLNGDEKVDFGEYMEYCWYEDCEHQFNVTDSDRNGVLDEADALNKAQEIIAEFDTYDANDDGEVTLEEYTVDSCGKLPADYVFADEEDSEGIYNDDEDEDEDEFGDDFNYFDYGDEDEDEDERGHEDLDEHDDEDEMPQPATEYDEDDSEMPDAFTTTDDAEGEFDDAEGEFDDAEGEFDDAEAESDDAEAATTAPEAATTAPEAATEVNEE